MKKIILASASPRRKEILEKSGFELKIIPSNYDEKICGLNYSAELVENCAYQKAFEVQKRIKPNLPVVGADTVVVSDGVILGKPKNKKDAFLMLKSLSCKTHFVATSFCILDGKKIVKNTDLTYVTFRKMTDFEITNYIDVKNPLDKAGSYGIQDDGFDFAVNVEGSINNVIGFPLEKFLETLFSI